jgi:hypothetical protein
MHYENAGSGAKNGGLASPMRLTATEERRVVS